MFLKMLVVGIMFIPGRRVRKIVSAAVMVGSEISERNEIGRAVGVGRLAEMRRLSVSPTNDRVAVQVRPS
jgi:hypothetical protein